MTLKRLLLGLVILLIAFIALVIYQWFGPAPPTTVSRQTTFITEPVDEDGLPNFALAILQQQRDGATPEINGALPFLQAMGPGEMSAADFALVANEIGLDQVDVSACLVVLYDDSLRQSLADWVAQQRDSGASEDASDSEQEFDYGYGGYNEDSPRVVADQLQEFATRTPWTGANIPLLAQWVASNQQSLDLLREAGARPKFYNPSPSLLRRRPGALVGTLLPGVQLIRSATRSLSARSMFYLGNGDHDAAWEDCLACWRLGTHAANGWTLVAQLVGIAVRGVAMHNTLVLLNDPDLPQPLAEQILSDLRALDDRIDVAEPMGFGERLSFIDSAIRLTAGGDEETASMLGAPSEITSLLMRVSFETDLVLRKANKLYDQLYAAASEDDYAARTQALNTFDAQLSGVGTPTIGSLAGSMLSRRRRSEQVGDVLIALMLPAVGAASQAADRDEANMELVRTAAALAIHRREHATYPDDLDSLTPQLLEEAPIDLFTGKPLIYERRGEGYLLYSVGVNGTDEGGDDEQGNRIVDGEWVDAEAEDYEQVSHREGDYVIRLPLPRPRMPSITLSEETGEIEAGSQ